MAGLEEWLPPRLASRRQKPAYRRRRTFNPREVKECPRFRSERLDKTCRIAGLSMWSSQRRRLGAFPLIGPG